ncbi:MAG: hypothetical protein K9K67_06010 [Bacteriovoracaceae bacterium]|nr:hypothetical protein [Bacteriovoracaceae bacterium]
MKICFSLLVLIFSLNAFSSFTYPIRSCDDFRLLKKYPNDKFLLVSDLSCYDLKLQDVQIPSFRGNLDGQNYNLNLGIDITDFDERALYLIGRLKKDSTIKNLKLSVRYYSNEEVSFYEQTPFISENNGLISNVHVSSDLSIENRNSDSTYSAGFVITNLEEGIINECTTIFADNNSSNVYGFAVYNYGIINNSIVHTLLIDRGDKTLLEASGFVGSNFAFINKSRVDQANILIPNNAIISGFSNFNQGSIRNSDARTRLKLNAANSIKDLIQIGGFITLNVGDVEYSSSYMNIDFQKDNNDRLLYFGPFFGNKSSISETNGYMWTLP